MAKPEYIIVNKAKEQSKLIMASYPNIRQKIKIPNTIIKPWIAYSYYAVPFSKLDSRKIDKILSK